MNTTSNFTIYWIKRHPSNIKFALQVFGIAVVLDIVGGLLPIDISLHGFLSMVVAIVSLYLYQDAVVTQANLPIKQKIAYIGLYFCLGLIVLLASSCLCALGTVKLKIVLLTVPTIGILMLFRMKWRHNI